MNSHTLWLEEIPISIGQAMCSQWHYSKTSPAVATKCFGVVEAGAIIGCVLFSNGANRFSGRPYGLEQRECVELVRVALRNHQCPTSKIVAMAIRLLKKSKPHLRLLISYADPKQGHHGGLYQSLGFVYSGLTKPNHNTVGVHKRTLHDTHGGSVRGQSYRYVKEVKHKYLLALDASLDDAINKLKVPYPTREKHNMVVQQSSRLQETVRV